MMIKGYAYRKDLMNPDAGFHVWPKDLMFGNYTEIVIFEAEKAEELRVLIDIIFQRAIDHPATDLEYLTDGADLEALAEIGGDTCDWTLTAIQAKAALKILKKIIEGE